MRREGWAYLRLTGTEDNYRDTSDAIFLADSR
ncbi:protein of unknown function [Cupriavidus neocaledonicus]|uniref:Uncharacterized protein n=1 Tax=Cupriavidus neocaledonicus TaxID=1040979 RepID=A0A375H7Z4_9BURK|nr:hypothetical protein CBM2605_A140147 [Cupriavidus neocaledonicus]SPD46603.1 protein of unknown function [Cupriavidus neocaledonicus]